jgi:hypothetical protein
MLMHGDVPAARTAKEHQAFAQYYTNRCKKFGIKNS